MNPSTKHANKVRACELILQEHFKKVAFHNFFLLYGNNLRSFLDGGTCSDMTLSFIQSARASGFDAKLHSAYIDTRPIHRLARLDIDGKAYYADVGNGWPAIKLYPANAKIQFESFGMNFRTEISHSGIRVFHLKDKTEHLQLKIKHKIRSEQEVLDDIASRFNSGIEYPFSNSPRFSIVRDDEFIFLRGDSLHRYSSIYHEVITGISESEIPTILWEYTGIALPSLKRKNSNSK